MEHRQRNVLAIIAMLLITLAAAWLLLPRAVDILPGQIRARLPETVLEMVTTPLPTALPAPLQPAEAMDPELLLQGTATQRVTATTTLTPVDIDRSEPGAIPTRVQGSAATTATPASTATPTPMPTATALPEIVMLAGLEVVPQKYNNCGPANLSILLNYYGDDISQLDIGEALKPNYEDRNVSPHELAAYVHAETDLRAHLAYGLDLSVLKRLLAADFPIIIEKGLFLSEAQGWMGHYLTLYGYDEHEEVFYGLDTFLGPWDSTGRSFDFNELDELWAQFNHATLVVYPERRRHELELVLGAAVLDQQAMWEAARDKAQAAIEEDTGDAFAWFGFGTSLYYLATTAGDDALYSQAAAAFDRAREIGLPWRTLWYQFEPYSAYIAAGRFDEVLALTEAVMTTSGGRNIEETYLYQGHALLATGDPEGARRAYERALRLNPGLDLAQDALQALIDWNSDEGG